MRFALFPVGGVVRGRAETGDARLAGNGRTRREHARHFTLASRLLRAEYLMKRPGLWQHRAMAQEGPQDRAHPSEIGHCEENERLINEFLATTRELVELQKQQTQAVMHGDTDFARFDILLHMAQERKQRAKYAWIEHVESHHC
jgi:hypothetical protein